jgi:hypothetical protein
MPAGPERQAGFGNGVPTHRPLPPDLGLPISTVPLWNKPLPGGILAAIPLGESPIPRGEHISAFSFFGGTLRAGQFAGAFPFGPRSTDCVFVLLAHTAQKSGKQKPFPAFNFSPLSKAEMTKAESRN